ncbi:HET-domain-containing protein [Stipitochalara longipes BDJ]|nr:HET-domain-containing protein [Stipitochalara longipes BDJ]
MWLLDTTSLTLSAFFDDNTPHYAILSHTWESEEVSFQDIQGPHDAISNRTGYYKTKTFCSKSLEVGFQYAWVDICCIDKTNNAELSEAINSMYRWYQSAVACYAYLADVGSYRPLATSRWFQRGWTLQELIAPSDVLFFDSFWNELGSKASLAPEIERITKIPAGLLTMETTLKDHCVAEVMSWATGRQTTRVEDRAYSLLGLFEVSMPLIYGEGAHAFMRLQLEIIKSTTDHSIFAFQSPPVLAWQGSFNRGTAAQNENRGILARWIDDFTGFGHVRSIPAVDETSFEMTNLGLRISLLCTLEGIFHNGGRNMIAYLNCEENGARLAIRLMEAKNIEGKPLGRFYRHGKLRTVSPEDLARREAKLTVLHIIQPTRGNSTGFNWTPSPARIRCSSDYGDMIEAGYLVERFFGQASGRCIRMSSRSFLNMSR